MIQITNSESDLSQSASIDGPYTMTPEEEAAYQRWKATNDWLHQQPDEFWTPYIGKWVAAMDRAIRFSGDSEEEATRSIPEDDLPFYVIEYVRIPGVIYIY